LEKLRDEVRGQRLLGCCQWFEGVGYDLKRALG
jgi:hypothetical protein